jgi:hypothetical protein
MQADGCAAELPEVVAAGAPVGPGEGLAGWPLRSPAAVGVAGVAEAADAGGSEEAGAEGPLGSVTVSAAGLDTGFVASAGALGSATGGSGGDGGVLGRGGPLCAELTGDPVPCAEVTGDPVPSSTRAGVGEGSSARAVPAKAPKPAVTAAATTASSNARLTRPNPANWILSGCRRIPDPAAAVWNSQGYEWPTRASIVW